MLGLKLGRTEGGVGLVGIPVLGLKLEILLGKDVDDEVGILVGEAVGMRNIVGEVVGEGVGKKPLGSIHGLLISVMTGCLQTLEEADSKIHEAPGSQHDLPLAQFPKLATQLLTVGSK